MSQDLATARRDYCNIVFATFGLVRTVVSISHCGCDDPGSIPGLDSNLRVLYPLVSLCRTTFVFAQGFCSLYCPIRLYFDTFPGD